MKNKALAFIGIVVLSSFTFCLGLITGLELGGVDILKYLS